MPPEVLSIIELQVVQWCDHMMVSFVGRPGYEPMVRFVLWPGRVIPGDGNVVPSSLETSAITQEFSDCGGGVRRSRVR